MKCGYARGRGVAGLCVRISEYVGYVVLLGIGDREHWSAKVEGARGFATTEGVKFDGNCDICGICDIGHICGSEDRPDRERWVSVESGIEERLNFYRVIAG